MPSCDIVINQFGAGSLFEPLANGKVVMPFFGISNDAMDKAFMAKKIDKRGVCVLCNVLQTDETVSQDGNLEN